MKCRECNTEMYIDHTELSEEGRIEKYVYVCVNPNCSMFREAQTLTGESAECRLQKQDGAE